MENRDLGWIGLGLGSPKAMFSPKNIGFGIIFGNVPLFGVPPGGVPSWLMLHCVTSWIPGPGLWPGGDG